MNDEKPHFVYAFMDPIDNVIFYIGKGQGDRPKQHFAEAAYMEKQSEKLNKIREIRDRGDEVKILFLARDFPKESEAFAIESLFIIESREQGTVLGLESNLTNDDSGHHEERFRNWASPDVDLEFDYRKRAVSAAEMYKECQPLYDYIIAKVPEFKNAITTTIQHIRTQPRQNGFDFVLNPKKGSNILFEYFARKGTENMTREDQKKHVEKVSELLGKEKGTNAFKIEHKRSDLNIDQHEEVAKALKTFIQDVYEIEGRIEADSKN